MLARGHTSLLLLLFFPPPIPWNVFWSHSNCELGLGPPHRSSCWSRSILLSLPWHNACQVLASLKKSNILHRILHEDQGSWPILGNPMSSTVLSMWWAPRKCLLVWKLTLKSIVKVISLVSFVDCVVDMSVDSLRWEFSLTIVNY